MEPAVWVPCPESTSSGPSSAPGLSSWPAKAGGDRIALDRLDATGEVRVDGGRVAAVEAGVANADDLAAAAEAEHRCRQGRADPHHHGGAVVGDAVDRLTGHLLHAVDAGQGLQLGPDRIRIFALGADLQQRALGKVLGDLEAQPRHRRPRLGRALWAKELHGKGAVQQMRARCLRRAFVDCGLGVLGGVRRQARSVGQVAHPPHRLLLADRAGDLGRGANDHAVAGVGRDGLGACLLHRRQPLTADRPDELDDEVVRAARQWRLVGVGGMGQGGAVGGDVGQVGVQSLVAGVKVVAGSDVLGETGGADGGGGGVIGCLDQGERRVLLHHSHPRQGGHGLSGRLVDFEIAGHVNTLMLAPRRSAGDGSRNNPTFNLEWNSGKVEPKLGRADWRLYARSIRAA